MKFILNDIHVCLASPTSILIIILVSCLNINELLVRKHDRVAILLKVKV